MKPSRTGEYLTFGLSLALVGGLLLSFIYSSFRHDSDHRLAFESKILWDQVSMVEGKSIIPLVVRNRGDKTANLLKLKIKTLHFETEAEIEYLTGNGSRKIFVILPGTPERDSITVTPIFYLLD